MFYNNRGWGFVAAGDCLEVYLPIQEAKLRNYPADAPYDVIKYDNLINDSDINKLVKELKEY